MNAKSIFFGLLTLLVTSTVMASNTNKSIVQGKTTYSIKLTKEINPTDPPILIPPIKK